MKENTSISDKLADFKLAGLRACAVAQAPLTTSGLVRGAAWLHTKRKQIKQFFKQKFARPRTVLDPARLNVLVHIRGGIGDVAMTRVFIQKLRQTLPKAHISFSYDSKLVVDTIFPEGLIDSFEPTGYRPSAYDVVLSGCHLLMYDYFNRPRLEQLAPHFLPILEQGISVQNCFKAFAHYSPHLDGQLAEISISCGGSRITNLGWFSGLEVHQNDLALLPLPEEKTREILHRFHLTPCTYITIHDGINSNTDTSCGYPTRCWPVGHWNDFCKLIKQQFPQFTLVQLGGPKSTPFPFVDVSLVGKTTITDLPYILDNARLHIDGESGLVHLAHLTRVRSIVLFGPSKAAYLGYARNVNITAPGCSGCMNIRPDWMTQCIFDKAHEQQCLAQITPQAVAFEVAKLLTATKN